MSRQPSTSGVRYVLLTGTPGIGKTTLVKKICEVLTNKDIPVQGFYTEEVRQRNTRIGFDVVTFHGDRSPLARASEQNIVNVPRVGKYLVNLKSFEDLAIPVLNASVSNKSVLVIDEIGKMEMFSTKFCNEVKSIFNRSRTILATIPVAPNAFVKHIQSLPMSKTFVVDYNNRNSLMEPIVDILTLSVENDVQ